MSIGDKIECNDLDTALEQHDALTRDGWDVDLEYRAGSRPVLTVKERIEE